MARNPIVELPKFGESLLTFTVHIKNIQRYSTDLRSLYTNQ